MLWVELVKQKTERKSFSFTSPRVILSTVSHRANSCIVIEDKNQKGHLTLKKWQITTEQCPAHWKKNNFVHPTGDVIMKLGLLLLLTVLVMVPSLSEGQRVRVCRRARRVASNLINRLGFGPEARAFVQRGEFNKMTSSSGINDAGTYSRLFYPFEKFPSSPKFHFVAPPLFHPLQSRLTVST